MNKKNEIIPSKEQQDIIDSLKVNDVVKVQAVAGSGKSTTIFLLAQQNPSKQILVITYNRFLKNEMSEKAKKLKLTNLSVYTYHGLATYIQLKNAHFKKENAINNDNLLNQWLDNPLNEIQIMKLKFDILVADEFQDCNALYWKFLTILLQTHHQAKLLALGDFRQTIYEFKESHDWWLNNLDQLIINKKVDQKRLSTSFRLPANIAHFLNTYCFDQDSDTIVSEKQNDVLVNYWHLTNLYDKQELTKIADFIQDKIDNHEYLPEDIFIISDSLNSDNESQSPSQMLENMLVKRNIPVFFPDDDQKSFDNKVIKHKLVFATPWTAKGRERKLVIYLSFGYIFNNQYDQQIIAKQILNQTYVGLTRALQEIVIVNASHHSHFRTSYQFVNYQQLMHDKHIQMPEWSRINLQKDLKQEFKKIDDEAIENLNLQGSRIGKFLSSNLEIKINQLLTQIKNRQKQKLSLIDLPTYTKKQNQLIQDISAINSILFTSLSVDKLLGYQTKGEVLTNKTLKKTWDHLWDRLGHSSYGDDFKYLINQKEALEKYTTLQQDLLLATSIYSLANTILNPIHQIKEFNWLDNFQDWELVKQRTVQTIQKAVDNYAQEPIDYQKAQLEIGLKLTKTTGGFVNEFSKTFLDWFQAQFQTNLKIKKYDLAGIFDLVASDIFFEFKFVDSLTIEHELQVVFYLFLLNLYQEYLHNDKYDKTLNEVQPYHFHVCQTYHLFNIRSNEWIVFENNPSIINQIMVLIVADKLKKSYGIPANFINDNKIKY